MKKIFNHIKAAVGAKLRGLSSQAFLRGEDVMGSNGGATLVSPYQQSVWVYTAVSALSTNVAKIPFRISQGERGGEHLVKAGPLVDLFNRPHPQMDRFLFWEMAVAWMALRGESFLVPLQEGRRISQMLILCPDQFHHVVANNALQGWRYTGSGGQSPLESEVFLPEEIHHLRLANPFDFWRGMNPLAVAMLPAQSDYASSQFMKGLMLNNADTGMIVSTEQQLTPEQREQMTAALRDRKRKAGTADRPIILSGGMKLEKPTISSADMQFLENRKMNRLEIGAVYGVPATQMGFTEDANRAIAEQEMIGFIENRISPLCERLEAWVEPVVKSFGTDMVGWFDIDSLPIMQAARRSRADTAVKYFAMGVPINICNKVLDLGLPPLPHGNNSYLTFSLQEVGAVADPAQAPAGPEGDQAKAADPIARMLGLLQAAASAPPPKAGPGRAPHQCGNSDEYAASIAGSVKNKTGKLSKYFFEQRGRVLARLDAVKAQRDVATLFLTLARSVEDVFDQAGEDEKLLAKLKPLLISDLEFGGAQLWKEIGLADFKLPPADAIKFLAKRQNMIKATNETTFTALKTSLQEGLAAGETFDDLVDRVKSIYTNATDFRAEMIALTETNVAVNSGRHEAMVQAKVPKKGWLSSNLETSRPSHQKAGIDYKQGIPIDDLFDVGGEKLNFPGDPAGSAENTINCKCTTFAVLDDAKGARIPTRMLRWEEWTGGAK